MNAGPAPFAIVGAAVLDGTGGPVLPGGQTVLVRDGRIAQVGPAGAVAVPSGVRVVDGTGLAVLPGFVDTHVHLGFYPAAEVLRGGVTTVRDLGWPAGPPRLLAAGQIVTAPGGYPSHAAWAPAGTAREVDGPDQAAAAVAGLAAAGASVVKVALDARVGPTLPAETLAAAVRAARRRGLGVTAHVAGRAEVEKALATGVTELAHWPFDGELPGDLVRRMAAALTVVPTLHVEPTRARRRGVREFLAAGGRVLYGTDLGNQGPPPGVDVVELALLVEAGLSPAGAVAAATSRAAEHLGLRGIGRVAPGWAADLLVVDGDPLRDLEALTRARLVSRSGWIAG